MRKASDPATLAVLKLRQEVLEDLGGRLDAGGCIVDLTREWCAFNRTHADVLRKSGVLFIDPGPDDEAPAINATIEPKAE